MLINKNDKFSIRKFKNGRSDSVKIGAIGVIVGTARSHYQLVLTQQKLR